MTSFLDEVRIIETKVETFLTEMINGVEHELEVIGQTLTHMSALIPNAAAAVQQAAAFIEGIPVVGQNPQVLAVVAAANIAMTGLNAFASVWNRATAPGGSGVTATVAKDAIMSGYQGYRQALSAANAAKAVAISVSQQPATPAPTVTH